MTPLSNRRFCQVVMDGNNKEIEEFMGIIKKEGIKSNINDLSHLHLTEHNFRKVISENMAEIMKNRCTTTHALLVIYLGKLLEEELLSKCDVSWINRDILLDIMEETLDQSKFVPRRTNNYCTII